MLRETDFAAARMEAMASQFDQTHWDWEKGWNWDWEQIRTMFSAAARGA